MRFYTYDLETFPNFFLFAGKFEDDPKMHEFEISDRVNNRTELLTWLSYLKNIGVYMVGANILHFDHPILYNLINNPFTFTAMSAYLLAQKIIDSQGKAIPRISLNDRIAPQVDLFKINHFDNKAKMTSLKSLQFAMRSESVEDLPIKPGQHLTWEQMDLMRKYGPHDVTETEKFLKLNKHLIVMRQELLDSGVIGGDVLNYSDVKIGEQYLIRRIGRQKCFVRGSKPRQTIRELISFKNIILPKISFRTEQFQKVHEWFKAQMINMGTSDRPKLEVELAGLNFVFGVGGVHASVDNQYFETTGTHVIKDIDVAGMYVAVAIANGFYPEHLGQDFVTAYKQLQSDRKQYPKGTTMNAVLKLAGNGVYGKSNNPYSCFYDPKYTFTVTVNGQLQLLQLVEVISLIPGIKLIQANTDGITALVPRKVEQFFDLWNKDWESKTNLVLEEVEYKRTWVRDVNSYLAEYSDGKVKMKGAYWYPEKQKDYDGWWNKDFSRMVTQKAIREHFINGHSIENLVKVMSDPFDFMLRYKTPGSATLYIGEKPQLRTVRYYVSTDGQPMTKVATPKGDIKSFKKKAKVTWVLYKKIMSEIPPLTWDERIHTKNKAVYAQVTTSIQSGRLVTECNHIKDFKWSNVDYDYYIKEVEKLLIGASNG